MIFGDQRDGLGIFDGSKILGDEAKVCVCHQHCTCDVHGARLESELTKHLLASTKLGAEHFLILKHTDDFQQLSRSLCFALAHGAGLLLKIILG